MCHEAQYFLRQVRRVRFLKPMLAGKAVNKWPIEFLKLRPGLFIPGITNADQQAGPGHRRVGHGGGLYKLVSRSATNLSPNSEAVLSFSRGMRKATCERANFSKDA